MNAQATWEKCLRKAAHSGFTVRQAVILWQKATHTTAYPVGVKPEPKVGDLMKPVADLWPQYLVRPWAAK